MRPLVWYTLGIVAITDMAILARTAGAQAAVNACSLLDAAELKQITKRKDVLGQGPQASNPTDLPKHMSACEFLNMNLTLTAGMTPESFAQNRQQQEARANRWKVASVSGVGDEAYYVWDPRPGQNRSVGIVLRAKGQQLAIGDTVPSDSIEAMKPILLSIAKQAVLRMK